MTDSAESPSASPARSALARSPLLAGLEPERLAQLEASAEPQRAAAGQRIFNQGERADHIYWLASGRIALHYTPSGDRPVYVSTAQPGEFLGVSDFVLGASRLESAEAIEPSELYRWPAALLRQLLEADPTLAAQLLESAQELVRRKELAALLVKFLGHTDNELLQEIQSRIEWVSLQAGDTLFAQGDASDRLYFVLNGRLEAVYTDLAGSSAVVGRMLRGETIGEMGVLTGEPRSATVRATTPAILVSLSDAVLRETVARHPSSLATVSEKLATRLRERTTPTVSRPLPIRIGVIAPVADQRCADFIGGLLGELRQEGPTLLANREYIFARMGDGILHQRIFDSARIWDLALNAYLEAEEQSQRQIVFELEPEMTWWERSFLTRLDDLLVVVPAARLGELTPGQLGTLEEHLRQGPFRVHLVVLEDAAGLTPIPEPLSHLWAGSGRHFSQFRAVGGEPRDVARIARYLCGRSLAVVLSGGGAKGFAHIGVLRAVQEAGITIDRIGGTSMGALIGAQYAMGFTLEEIQAQTVRMCRASIDFTIPIVAITSGRRLPRQLRRIFGERRSEDLAIPYFSLCASLDRGEVVVDCTGSLERNVRASVSTPGLAPPVAKDGQLCVDGFFLNNLPVDVMQELNNGGPVLAVDVTQEPTARPITRFPLEGLAGWWALLLSLVPLEGMRDYPSMPRILMRALELKAVPKRLQARWQATYYLAPPVDEFSAFDFAKGPAVAQVGYTYAKAALARMGLPGPANQAGA